MSSNPQPEQEGKERWRSGCNGGGMFNVASLCGLKASRVRVLKRSEGLVQRSVVSMDQDWLWFH